MLWPNQSQIWTLGELIYCIMMQHVLLVRDRPPQALGMSACIGWRFACACQVKAQSNLAVINVMLFISIANFIVWACSRFKRAI